ncbi:MAG: TlpA family protein disulfide reductase, partial [Isosphaeraceae bacterium]
TLTGVMFLAALAASGAGAAEPRPAFPAIEVTDLKGQTYQLKDFLGTATLLNFWATWCGPCRMELPELQKLYNEFGGKGLVVLAVDVDVPVSTNEEGMAQQLEMVKPRIEVFLARTGITLPVYLIDGKTQATLGVDRIPISFLLDREGGVVRIYPGYVAEAVKDLRQQVIGVLAERSAKGGK